MEIKKPVSKGELAKQFGWKPYFLTRRINYAAGLVDELKEKTGYNPYQRIFTPRQVLIIFEYLGNPHELKTNDTHELY